MNYQMEIRDIIAESGLNMAQFARKYKIPYRTLQNWEGGARTPPEYVLILLRRCVEMDYSG